MSPPVEKIPILCVDDNPLVLDALELKLGRSDSFAIVGRLAAADDLLAATKRDCPKLVLLDLDMPGKSSIQAIEELVRECPACRVIVLTGHVRADLIEKAIQAGAWGYISKNDADRELESLLAQVLEDQMAFSTEARATYDRL